MRLGNTEERPANRVDQAENGLTVLVAGKHAIEPEKIIANGRLVGLDHADQIRCEIVQLIGHDHHAGHHLLGTCRPRLDLQPQAGRFEGQVKAAGKPGHLDRPLKYLGLTGTQGEIGVRLGRQFEIAALQGDFGNQDLIDVQPELIGVRRISRSRYNRRRRACFENRRGTLFCRNRFASGQCRQAEGKRQCGKTENALNGFHGFLARLDQITTAWSRLRHNGFMHVMDFFR